MAIFIITFSVMLLFVLAMSVGVLMGKEPLKGSCGGVNAAMGTDEPCEFCGGDTQKCEELNDSSVDKKAAKELSFNLMSGDKSR